MKTVLTPKDLQELCMQLKSEGKVIGFVPTMGALHDGHLSLLREARKNSDVVIASIFVNPTQFDKAQDLARYPRTWDADLELAKSSNVDVVFFPSFEEIYPDNFAFFVNENDFSQMLCGSSRSGHFKGVLTVVLKLINLTQATRVYMGEKDYQQYQLVKKMASALFLAVEIIGCPTLRNSEGLALSSRNTRLSNEDTLRASMIYKTITSTKTALEAQKKLENLGFEIDYLVDIGDRRYVAAFLPSSSGDGDVRLIDNVQR